MSRRFSPEEVNLLIPELNRIFAELERLREAIIARANEIERLGLAPEASPELTARQQRLGEARQAFEKKLEEIGTLGGLLEDLDLGRVDFPSEIDGQAVMLCWQLGDAEVAYFHDADRGDLRGRSRLPE